MFKKKSLKKSLYINKKNTNEKKAHLYIIYIIHKKEGVSPIFYKGVGVFISQT